MTRNIVLTAIVAVAALGSCSKAPTSEDIPIYPVVVGEKTPLYEVDSARSLKLAPGVGFKVVKGSSGQDCGIVLMRPNGEVGGYMECGCVGAQTGNCVTENDNPEHPSCRGGCVDSEGNAHGCDLFGPLIGPPRDPALIRFRARR